MAAMVGSCRHILMWVPCRCRPAVSGELWGVKVQSLFCRLSLVDSFIPESPKLFSQRTKCGKPHVLTMFLTFQNIYTVLTSNLEDTRVLQRFSQNFH